MLSFFFSWPSSLVWLVEVLVVVLFSECSDIEDNDGIADKPHLLIPLLLLFVLLSRGVGGADGRFSRTGIFILASDAGGVMCVGVEGTGTCLGDMTICE